MKQRSLKRRIQGTFVLILMLPMLTLAFVATAFFYKTVSDATFRESQRRISAISDIIENEIKQVERHIVTFTKELDSTSFSSDRESTSIKQLVENYESIYQIKLLDKDGIVQLVEPYNRNEIGRDLSYTQYIKKATEDQKLTWSTSYMSPISKTPVNSFALPISSGIVVVTFDISKFSTVIKTYSDNSVKVAIVDKGGVFLSHTDREKYEQRQWEPQSELIRQQLQNRPELEHYIIDDDQQNIILGNMIYDTGLMIILYQDKSVYLSPIRSVTVLFATGFIFFAIIVVIISFKISNYFFSYISSLSDNIHSIAKGDYTTSIDAKGFTELIKVKKSFENMAEKIEEREEKIQSLNTELQKKLSEAETAIKQKNAAEEQLKTSHATLLAVLNGMDSTIYVADMESYEILFVNKYMTELYGDNLIGSSCFHSLKVHGSPCGYCPDKDHDSPCGQCPNKNLIDEHGKPNDGYVWENTNVITGKTYMNHDLAIRWVDGRLVRMQIATDVSKLKDLEGKLKQAQKMEAIGTLAGGIAHDFNNILSAIIGYSSLAIEEFGPTSKRLNHDLTQIMSASKRAADLVKQILHFSRKSDKNTQPVILQPIIDEAIKLLRSTIPTTIDFHIDLDNNISSLVSPTEFHQIIMNLGTNAYHAMKRQGGLLSIELKNIGFQRDEKTVNLLSQQKQYCQLVVRDTGDGIAPELLGKIFEPYFTSKDIGEGTGLGLAVVHGLVKNFDGEIIVESTVNEGTAFNIYLPLYDSDSDNPDELAQLENNHPRGKEKLVIVDDDVTLLKMNERLLSSLGYSIKSFKKGEKALDFIISNADEIDLIVSDVTMPKMTGVELFERIKAVAPQIPVILYSGYSDIIDQETALSIGVKHYLLKPLSKEDLAISIRNVLDENSLK